MKPLSPIRFPEHRLDANQLGAWHLRHWFSVLDRCFRVALADFVAIVCGLLIALWFWAVYAAVFLSGTRVTFGGSRNPGIQAAFDEKNSAGRSLHKTAPSRFPRPGKRRCTRAFRSYHLAEKSWCAAKVMRMESLAALHESLCTFAGYLDANMPAQAPGSRSAGAALSKLRRAPTRDEQSPSFPACFVVHRFPFQSALQEAVHSAMSVAEDRWQRENRFRN